MPSKSPLQAMHDIAENIRLADDFLGALTLEQFAADRRTVYAVSRCLEIVSEAARRLPPEVQQRHPQLPWQAIMSLGNVYRHEYRNVVEERTWRTVRESLPSLAEAVESEIARIGQRSSTDG